MRRTTVLTALAVLVLTVAVSALPEAGDIEADYDANHLRGETHGGGDMFPKMVDPPMAGVAEADEVLAGGDWVVGVSIGGEHQAFPIAVLGWPEVVNTGCGGTPIAVTW